MFAGKVLDRRQEPPTPVVRLRSSKNYCLGERGIMEKKGNYHSILGLYRDNGKQNGNYHSILGLYRDNGKENGTTI